MRIVSLSFKRRDIPSKQTTATLNHSVTALPSTEPTNKPTLPLLSGMDDTDDPILLLSPDLERTNDFIPLLSDDLLRLKDNLGNQLRALEEVLAQRNAFIFKKTTKEYDDLVMRFLRVLGNYLGITLMDVFRVIENIQRLMKDYEDSLQHFVRHSASTIQTLDFCTREVEALVEQHSIAIQELTQISSTIQALGEYYTAESEDLMNGCVTAKIVSIALSITGFAAGASMAIFVPPLAAVGAGALVATGGGISAIISQYDANKSEIYAMATAKLTMVDDYNQAFQAPIKTIFLKLSASKRQLTALQHRNSKLTTADLAESDREKSYARAQKEAEEIDRVCNEIYDYALQVTVLRGQLGAKLEQITEK